MPEPQNKNLTISTDGEGIYMQLGDVAWAGMSPADAWKVGTQLLEMSCRVRGLKDSLFIIEPSE